MIYMTDVNKFVIYPTQILAYAYALNRICFEIYDEFVIKRKSQIWRLAFLECREIRAHNNNNFVGSILSSHGIINNNFLGCYVK